MLRIKQFFLAIFMTSAVIPAWGMYLSSIIAEKALSMKSTNGLMAFQAQDDNDARRVLQSAFGRIPAAYLEVLEKKAPGEILLWKENDRIEGALILEKRSPVEIYINYLGVHQDSQEKGIGTKMLHALEKEHALACPQSACFITLHSYTKALGFYKKLGFNCGYSEKCTKKVPAIKDQLYKPSSGKLV